MDTLAAELSRARERSIKASVPSSSSSLVQRADGRKVFIRSSESARAPDAGVSAPSAHKSPPVSAPASIAKSSSEKTRDDAGAEIVGASSGVPLAHVNASLRRLGLPVAFFGESTVERRERLFSATGDSRVLLAPESPAAPAVSQKRPRDEAVVADTTAMGGASEAKPEEAEDGQSEDEDGHTLGSVVAKGEAGKAQPRVALSHASARKYALDGPSGDADLYLFHFWRGVLSEWGAELAKKSTADKATAIGAAEVASHQSATDAMRPFFQLCRRRLLPTAVRDICVEIVDKIFSRDYMAAGDAYIRLAVGKGQWVIGVSQVGIHERASRERLYLGKIAHVMNDETQRRYITTIKRLMTWMQTSFPPADPSRFFKP